MISYVKSAGSNEKQDYWWYKVTLEGLESCDELQFKKYKDVNFYFESVSDEFTIYIKHTCANRKDNWGRAITNHFLFNGSKNEVNSIEAIVQHYLMDYEAFFSVLDETIVENESKIGFEFDIRPLMKLERVIIEKKYVKPEKFISYSNKNMMEGLIKYLNTGIPIVLVDTPEIKSEVSTKNMIYIGDDVTEQEAYFKNNKIKKNKIIKSVLFGSAFLSIGGHIFFNRKKRR